MSGDSRMNEHVSCEERVDETAMEEFGEFMSEVDGTQWLLDEAVDEAIMDWQEQRAEIESRLEQDD